jgi:hypothetical protein
MELKEFIVQTITAIADATVELQGCLEYPGTTVNPPTSSKDSNHYIPGGVGYIYRRVQDIQFDVAVTTRAEDTVEAKGGLKVYVLEARAGGSEKSSVETASRVKFTVPIALAASNDEGASKQAGEQADKNSADINCGSDGGGVPNSWMGR